MENIRDIKDRIKSVREIHKITRAMKMVATAKYKKVQKKLDRTRGYLTELEELMWRVKNDVVVRYNPFFSKKKHGSKHLIVVISSDRGLCGAFNTNLIRFANDELANSDLFVIGKKGINILRRQPGATIIGTMPDVFVHPDFKTYCRISEAIQYEYLVNKYASVKMLYTSFESMARQPIVLKQLFPLENVFKTDTENTDEQEYDADTEQNEKKEPSQPQYPGLTLFEPSADDAFDTLVRHYIDVSIQRIMEESYLSEQIIRMNAMEAATTNADELINGLILAFNRARQSVITTELLEIVGGAEALKA